MRKKPPAEILEREMVDSVDDDGVRWVSFVPVVACKAEWRSHGALVNSPRYWSLTFNCPWCGRVHRHGGGSGPIPDDGHRVPHCPSFNNRGEKVNRPEDGYILKVIETHR